MCGIVGYVGQGQIQKALLEGLQKLEYRGYDSAGIITLNQSGEPHLDKTKGRIQDLREIVDFNQAAQVGIGHTRWATHGPATSYNAHPHLSPNGRYALVHNGVIENYNELRDQYLDASQLQSDTDTEIIVALIEKFAETNDLSTLEAFQAVLKEVRGSYAFGLIDTQEPGILYAAKHKSPLLIGLGEDFNVIASDAMATIELTNNYVEIRDGEIVILKEDAVEIMDLQGQNIDRDSYIAELDADDLDKGAYPFYMLKEVDEQPTVFRRLIQEYSNKDGQFEISQDLVDEIKQADRIHIVACGTSYNAGLVGKRLFEDMAKIPTEVHLASEFAYHLPLLSEKPFFVFLTQSGETADSRQALVKVNEREFPSLTITNVKGSTLSREASHTLLLHAGPEIAVASTKAYTAQIAVMAILCDVLTEEKAFDMAHELGLVASNIESVLTQKDQIKTWVDENLATTRNAFFIGRQMDYYVTMEAALKLKEISYIQTEAFAAGELKHGTIALIEEGTPVIALISDKEIGSHTRGNVEEVKARGANAMIVSMEGADRESDQFNIGKVENLLSPMVMVVVTQLIAYYAALGRGLDVDKPRNLAKSVTVE